MFGLIVMVITAVKNKVVNYEVNDRGHAPEWNFDGSSTDQIEEYMDAYGERIDHSDNTEIKLVPVAIFKDPFRNRTRDRIVLCRCYNVDDTPLACNCRYFAVQQAFRFQKKYQTMVRNGTGVFHHRSKYKNATRLS